MARDRGRPRRATGRRSAAADTDPRGRRRTAPPGGASGLPGRCRRVRCARGPARRPLRMPRARATSGTRAAAEVGAACGRRVASVSRAWTSSSRRQRRRRSPSTARPASQARPVRRSHATTQSCKRQPQRREPLVVDGDRRQPLEGMPEVVAEEPNETAEEGRRVGRTPARGRDGASSRRAMANGSAPAAGASTTATGSAVRYVQRALRPGRALSRRASPGKSRNASAASMGRTPRSDRQPPNADRRRWVYRARPGPTGIMRPMIRPKPADDPDGDRAGPATLPRCEHETSGSGSASGRRDPTTRSPTSPA